MPDKFCTFVSTIDDIHNPPDMTSDHTTATSRAATHGMRFSILIPTWNNLPYLKLCVESIRRHSAVAHQIIIHVNDGSDGTLQWVRSQGLDHTLSTTNIGVCLAMNSMRPLVKTDYILFLNDDMYVLPGWDTALMDHISSLPDKRFFLSSTTIQPHTASGPVIKADYGDTPETFRCQALLNEYQSLQKPDWMGATLPPNIVHRDIWDLVGGYSVEYSPGMYSDPDFTAKLWFCGIRHMIGISASRVYHFETKSTTRIRRNPGRRQFLMKWGITSSTFRRLLTHRDRDYDPALTGSYNREELRRNILRSRLEAIRNIILHGCGPLWKLWNKNQPETDDRK